MQREQLVSMLGLTLASIALVTSGVTWTQVQRAPAAPEQQQSPEAPLETVPPPEIVPPPAQGFELGTHMATLARRAATLWFVAKVGNQPAAEYEMTEMGELMDQIIAAAPVVEGSDVNVAGVLDAVRNTHFPKLRSALRARDTELFEKCYRDMLESCNSCHQNAGRPFIRLKVPDREPVTNRDWSAGMK